MNINRIESLLNKVETIRNKSEEAKQRSFNKGKEFDVFSIVGLWDEEVNLHSAIIAELLNPNGSHGAGDIFLKLFLQTIGMESFPINSRLVKPHSIKNITERYIGPKTDTTGGRLDIEIEDGTHALIIENKPGNEDQQNQLIRYNNYARKKFKRYILVYLTKDGREASKLSTGNKKIDYQCVSYIDLIHWLGRCSSVCSSRQNIKTIINQYKLHLKKIMGISMDDNNTEKLLSLLTQKNNALATKEIICMEQLWLDKIIRTYIFKPLQEYAKSVNMLYSEKDSGIYIHKDSWKHYGIFLWTDNKTWRDIYVSVSYFDKPGRDDKLYLKDCKQLDCLSEKPCESDPYGWEFLPSEFSYWGFDNADKIINKEVFEWVKNKFNEIIDEIETQKLKII